jgi:hypothetical protein
MPFIRRNFVPIGGQSTPSTSGTGEAVPGAPQRWSYRTQDAHATVDTSGYFNDVRLLLEVGDIIDVVVINGSGVVQTYGPHIVMTKTATAVDVSAVTVGVVTNSD